MTSSNKFVLAWLSLVYWSVRRLKASPTPPCGIFNIIFSGMRGLGIQIVLLLSCLVVLSEYQKVNKDDWLTVSVIYFRNLLSNWDSGEKVLKSFKEVGLAKSEKKLHPYFSEDPKCSIFSKSSWQLGFRWEGSTVFQEGWPCHVWKEASSLFLWRPQVLYIFEILLANVTQWEGYQVL